MKTMQRIKQIIASNINHVIEKAEDPEKMIKQLIRDMDESIVSLRLEVAKAIASEKRLVRRVEHAERSIKRWREDSEHAVRDGNDDLARQAIAKKLDEEKILEELKPQCEKAAAVSKGMREDLQRLENKVQEARRGKNILIARKRRAEAQKSMLDASQKFADITTRADSLLAHVVTEAPETLESLEESVLELETENEARRELIASGRGIEEKLDEVRQIQEVEEALNEIKKKSKKR